MAKISKTKKGTDIKNKSAEEDIKKIDGEDEETEKEGGALSDGVLDAFDEVAPVDPLADPLLEDESIPLEDGEDDELDSGDYRANDEW